MGGSELKFQEDKVEPVIAFPGTADESGWKTYAGSSIADED